ncbi:hypothetical protein [Nocardioides bruguierae]|uniref:Uncharacterized protein n=1 Tax=Nocardioides bruguierae TaxID=2945102 RepID=A0A9X2IFE3_9ACTN|nr:hypothetical protein [Nocardioides bruguierae]MCM0620334.1 hypothetical protein [Nocardioides bruguierae]
MAKRRFVIQVGLHHAGAGSLGEALAASAETLAEHGVHVPARSREDARDAALELRRLHRAHGRRRKDLEGSWARLCRRARKPSSAVPGAVVVAEDLLAGAGSDQIDLLLDSLAGFEVHVVVTAADPSHQLVRSWVQAVRDGSSLTLPRYARRVLATDSEHDEALAFQAEQDLPEVLGRWASEVGRADRVHVVVPDAGQDAASASWAVVARLVGVDPVAVPLDLEGDPEPDLAGLAVLREVNEAVDGRTDAATRRATALTSILTPAGGDAPADVDDLLALLPETMLADLEQRGRLWAKAVQDGGHSVTGDPERLVPALPATATPAEPDVEHRLQVATDALADLLVDVARLREQVGDLEHRNARLESKLEKKKRKLRDRLAEAG